MKIHAAGVTDQGRVRRQNEDNYSLDSDTGLFIVSDGLGGHAAGELASKIIVEVLPELFQQHQDDFCDLSEPSSKARAGNILTELSKHLYAESRKHLNFAGMGATAVVACVRDPLALIAHMGDSRAYLFRRKRLIQLTTDHSIVQLLIDNGEITPEEAKTHPARSQITQYVGMAGESLPEVQTIQLQPDDRLLLCTDGLTGMLADTEIAAILSEHPEPENACHPLINGANDAGGKDNITVVIVKISD